MSCPAVTPPTGMKGPTFLSALLGIGLDGSPWQYMLSMRRQGYGGVTRVPLGPFGGDYYFLLEPEVLNIRAWSLDEVVEPGVWACETIFDGLCGDRPAERPGALEVSLVARDEQR